MIFGKLDRKLTLYNQTFTTNTYGERVSSTPTSVTIYADFNFKSGSTKFESDVLVNEENIECLIRYRTAIGVSPDYYLTDGDISYAITSIREVGRKDKMILSINKKDLTAIFSS
jgi:head-tail adaptor